MEINKLLPEVVMRFDFEFEDSEREWTVHNDWFVKQECIKVRVRKRKTEPSSNCELGSRHRYVFLRELGSD